jgi:hypothetical protein
LCRGGPGTNPLVQVTLGDAEGTLRESDDRGSIAPDDALAESLFREAQDGGRLPKAEKPVGGKRVGLRFWMDEHGISLLEEYIRGTRCYGDSLRGRIKGGFFRMDLDGRRKTAG